MDSLADLPVVNTKITPSEQAVVDRLFGRAPPAAAALASSDSPQAAARPRALNVRLAVGCLTLVFILLANPWSAGVLGKLPKCQSEIPQLVIKTVIFLIVTVVVLQWIL